MTSSRLPAPLGTRLDRSRTVAFEFNGVPLQGHPGDTLASALLANDVRLVGRSFKLHRPRGIFACGVEEPCALVDVGEGAYRTPNTRATLLDVYDGLRAVSVNCWPSVRFDVGALNGLLAAFLPAGFYYKTFMWPSWQRFEPAIRRMAGLGRGTRAADPDRYEEAAATADVLVVGGGSAGLSAATAAASAGADTLLLSARDGHGVAQPPVAAALRAGVRMLRRTAVFGVYDHGLVCASERLEASRAAGAGVLRERVWKIRARHVIAAAGAFERPVLFPDNDRPGVMLAGAAWRYAQEYGVACGRRVLIVANSDSAYATAGALCRAGVNVVAIADRRPSAAVGPDCVPPAGGGVRLLAEVAVAAVKGGAAGVQRCTLVDAGGRGAAGMTIECDAILSAGGWAPAVHLHSQAGGKLKWVDESAMFVPDGPARGLVSVGACAGCFDPQAAVEHAAEVGRALAAGRVPPQAPIGGAGRSLAATGLGARRVSGKQFVDLQNDVTVADVALAARENYRSVEHLKRYTTNGMGTDQGKTSNVNALLRMGELTGREPAAVGTTRFRPPFAPVTLGAFAGRRVGALYRPCKVLPAAAWHAARGALFERFGAWERPAAYPLAGETLESAAQREALAVRQSVGVLDGSPLGKLEIFGRDAAHFLDLMYLGTMSTLRLGQARYGLVLNEHGVVVDDGIVARMGKQHFWVNTTSAGVERTTAAFEEWLQCEYPHLSVFITPVTSRWGNVTVAGPRAWELLAAAGMDAAFAPAAMPHMTLRTGDLDGIPLRVLRASFSGEVGYEINIPTEQQQTLLERLWRYAPAQAAVPYGIEALEILRTEKGFVHIGTDTDGTTLPGDLGFGANVERKAANFVGRRSLLRPAARDPRRLQLVALRPRDGLTRLPVGAQFANAAPPALSEGFVTSSYRSPSLEFPVALGLLAGGRARLGETIRVHHLGAVLEAQVVKAPFIDPAGERLRG